MPQGPGNQIGSRGETGRRQRQGQFEPRPLDRQIGGGIIYAKDHFTLSAGIFGPFAEDDEVYLKDVKTGAARATVAPINREVNGVHQVLHLGASWRYRENSEDLRSPEEGSTTNPFNDQLFRYRARGADLHLADRFVQTPQIFDEDTFWGLEGAAIWGPVHVVGEYTELKPKVIRRQVTVGQDEDFVGFACCNGSDPTYNGYYIEAGWFLTGETRSYKEGEFGRIKVKNPVLGGGKGGGWGAWQIAGRYDLRRGRPGGAATAAVLLVSELAVDAQAVGYAMFALGPHDGTLLLGALDPRPSIRWLLGSGEGPPVMTDVNWGVVLRP